MMRAPVISLVAAGCLLALGAQAAEPPPGGATPAPVVEGAAAAPAAPSHDLTPLVVGLGAIAGVAAFNVLGLGWSAIPASGAYELGATVPAEMSVAMSRVYATSSAVIGGLLADSLFSPSGGEGGQNLQSRLFTIGSGALFGILTFNLVSAPWGTVPFAGAALEPVPTAIALGSRLVAVASGGVGAITALWLYDHGTGRPFDGGLVFSLAGGAAAGVAAGNLLTYGIVGTLPVYSGIGAETAALGGSVASAAAQAASRVYVIGSGILGGLAGGYLYQAAN